MAEFYLNKSQSSGKYIQGKVVYSSTQTTSTNKSSVTATLYVRKGDTTQTLTIPTNGTWNYSLSIAGNTFSNTVTASVLLDWVKIASHTVKDISHNSDGSKTITISGSITAPSGTSFAGHKTSSSQSVSLPTIPRCSSISSASNITLGNKCNIKWIPASSSFAYKLKFVSGDVSYTTGMITPNTTSEYTYNSYTMSVADWAKSMPSSYSQTCTVTLYTYSSSSATSAMGSSPKNFTLTLSNSIKPTISSFTLEPVDDLDGLYVQGKSKCSLSMQFAAGTGSTIASYSIKGSGISKSGTSSSATSLSGTTGVITQSGTLTYTATVADKRTTSSPISTKTSIYVYPYAKPTISISAARTSTSGSVKISYKATYSHLDAKNNLQSMVVYRKLSTDNSWVAYKTITFGTEVDYKGNQSGSFTLTECDGLSSYDFYATISDTAYGSIGTSNTVTVPSEFRLVNIDVEEQSIAFGKMAEVNNLFECELPVKFNDTLSTLGNITTGSNFGSTQAYNADSFAMFCQWADKNNHDILVRSDDGLGMGLGWKGNEDYITTLDIRPQVVNMRGTLTAPRGIFTAKNDAESGKQIDVAVRIGDKDGHHIDIDSNEIIAKNDPTTLGGLYFGGNEIGSYVNEVATFVVGKDETSEYIRSLPTYNRTYDNSPNIYITSYGTFGRSTSSSQRYKTDITNVSDNALNPYNILNIPVRQYKYNRQNVPVGKSADDLYIGLIAEEVEKLYPAAAEYNEDGQVEMWNIKVIVPAMLKIMQDQQNEIAALKDEINKLKSATQN
jgi:hypothetical protein